MTVSSVSFVIYGYIRARGRSESMEGFRSKPVEIGMSISTQVHVAT